MSGQRDGLGVPWRVKEADLLRCRRVGHVDDTQAGPGVGDAGIVSTQGDGLGPPWRVVKADLDRYGRVGHVDDAQTPGEIGHVGIVTGNGEPCCVARGVVETHFTRRSGVGHVDDAQAARIIGNVGVAPGQHDGACGSRGVVVTNLDGGGRVAHVDDAQSAIAASDVGVAAVESDVPHQAGQNAAAPQENGGSRRGDVENGQPRANARVSAVAPERYRLRCSTELADHQHVLAVGGGQQALNCRQRLGMAGRQGCNAGREQTGGQTRHQYDPDPAPLCHIQPSLLVKPGLGPGEHKSASQGMPRLV